MKTFLIKFQSRVNPSNLKGHMRVHTAVTMSQWYELLLGSQPTPITKCVEIDPSFRTISLLF